MYSIKSMHKDSSGNTFAYVLDDGTLLSTEDAFKLVREGRIHNFITGVNENGEKTIHVVPMFDENE